MRNFKRAKMTGKARDAIATYAAHYGISISDVRTDRAAIRGIYAELEANGYVWQASKQSWAYIPQQEASSDSLVFLVSAADADFAEAWYIVKEGLKAAGYEPLSESEVPDIFHNGTRGVIIEVKR